MYILHTDLQNSLKVVVDLKVEKLPLLKLGQLMPKDVCGFSVVCFPPFSLLKFLPSMLMGGEITMPVLGLQYFWGTRKLWTGGPRPSKMQPRRNAPFWALCLCSTTTDTETTLPTKPERPPSMDLPLSTGKQLPAAPSGVAPGSLRCIPYTNPLEFYLICSLPHSKGLR